MGRVVTRTMKQAIAEARIDERRVNATTDDEIRRQMIEDGDDPDADHDDWHPSAMQVRKSLKLTQEGIADLLGMPVATWRNWEQGRTAIDAPGRALLKVLQKEPEAVLRAMKRADAA